MENKLEQLKEKIWEAVPEILELKFGCWVKKYQDIGIILDKDSVYFRKSWMDDGQNIYWIQDDDNFEILGRPITLEDVLVAFEIIFIRNVQEKMSPRREWELQSNLQLTFEDTAMKIIKKWRLNKPLDQQSEETINFLCEVILKN